MKLLIVDDEPDVRALVGRSFGYERPEFTVLEAADGEEALRIVSAERPDLVVLDLMLPGRDGFSVLEELRRTDDVPVIVLTAKGLERDRVRGLELGADDYVVKPFSPRELVARVDAVLRRARASAPRRGVVERAEVRIDLSARRVTRGGSEVRLTPTEFNLLAELATHPGEALGHETLLGSVWGSEYRTETHYLKVYVGRLRDKLERDPANPRLILTVRGIGYRFADAGEAPG